MTLRQTYPVYTKYPVGPNFGPFALQPAIFEIWGQECHQAGLNSKHFCQKYPVNTKYYPWYPNFGLFPFMAGPFQDIRLSKSEMHRVTSNV